MVLARGSSTTFGEDGRLRALTPSQVFLKDLAGVRLQRIYAALRIIFKACLQRPASKQICGRVSSKAWQDRARARNKQNPLASSALLVNCAIYLRHPCHNNCRVKRCSARKLCEPRRTESRRWRVRSLVEIQADVRRAKQRLNQVLAEQCRIYLQYPCKGCGAGVGQVCRKVCTRAPYPHCHAERRRAAEDDLIGDNQRKKL